MQRHDTVLSSVRGILDKTIENVFLIKRILRTKKALASLKKNLVSVLCLPHNWKSALTSNH